MARLADGDAQALGFDRPQGFAARDQADVLARQRQLGGDPAADRPGADNADIQRSLSQIIWMIRQPRPGSRNNWIEFTPRRSGSRSSGERRAS